MHYIFNSHTHKEKTMTNLFDNWKPHCHYLGDLMTPAKGESNLKKWEVANANFRATFKELRDIDDERSEKYLNLHTRMMNEMKIRDDRAAKKHIPHLSAGCITKLYQIYIQEKFKRRKHLKNRFLEKGLMIEEDCITLYSLNTGEFHKKNTIQFENDWIVGTPDILTDKKVVDTKGSWDIFTYGVSKYKKISSLYHWQLEGYMWLGDVPDAELAYCLINTPEHLIKAEEKKLMYELFGNEGEMLRAPDYMRVAYEEECQEIRKNHIFDDMEIKDRIKIFNVKQDESRIDRIKYVVEGSRWFLNNIEELELNEDEIWTEKTK